MKIDSEKRLERAFYASLGMMGICAVGSLSVVFSLFVLPPIYSTVLLGTLDVFAIMAVAGAVLLTCIMASRPLGFRGHMAA